MQHADREAILPTASRGRCLIVLLVAITLCGLVLGHVHDVNGPWYWKWPWRRLPAWPTYPLVALAASPLFVAQWLFDSRRASARGPVALLILACFALQMTCCLLQPLGRGRIAAIVDNVSITSYYTAANRLDQLTAQGIGTRDWLAIYPELLPRLPEHASVKPPGPILYFLCFLRWLGDTALAKTAAGVGLMLLATAVIPCTYGLARSFAAADDTGRAPAFAGASLMTLCPALLQFCPRFDQIYPAFLCGLIMLWIRSARTGRLRYAIAFAGLLWVGSMLSYITLVVGAFLIAWTLLQCVDGGLPLVVRAARQAVIVAATVLALYGLLWWATAFDPIASFRAIGLVQDSIVVAIHRPFPIHIVFDLLDVALGMGWIVLILAILFMTRRSDRRWTNDPPRQLVWLTTLQIGVLVGGAFLPGETARLYLIVMPLVAAVAGLELAQWGRRARVAVYVASTLIVAVYLQNLVFINIGEHLPDHQIGVPDSQGHVRFE